jgi:hypothetical protein
MSDETGASILETESYIIALVFLAFLALFITFEKVRKLIALAVGVDRLPLCTRCVYTGLTLPAGLGMATSFSQTTAKIWPAGEPCTLQLSGQDRC